MNFFLPVFFTFTFFIYSLQIKVDETLIKKQRWALNFLNQITFEGKYDDEPKVDFPFSKLEDLRVFEEFDNTSINELVQDSSGSFNELFQLFEAANKIKMDNALKTQALESLLYVKENRFLDKNGVFTFLSERILKETKKLFDIFYFVKDWETFIKIAKWAKQEVQPLQLAFIFYVTITSRNDTQGIKLPPLYEVLPNFYVPSYITKQIYSTYSQGIKAWTFPVNNTGYEWNGNSDYSKSVNLESKISYFREDADLGNWFASTFYTIPSFFNRWMYPDIKFSRRGEVLQSFFNFLLNRYNMERYANWLPPTLPIQFNKPLEGYNSHLNDVYGRGFLERIDGLTLFEHNYDAAKEIEDTIHKFKENLMRKVLQKPGSNKYIKLEGIHGLNILYDSLYGSADSINSLFDTHLIYTIYMAINGMITATNDREFTTTVAGRKITLQRDPVTYRILTTIRELETVYLNLLEPYSKKELEMPGVEIEDVNFSHLETHFERFNFSISNLVPVKESEEKPNFMASTIRLNHKPFTYDITIISDRVIEAYIKIFLGPLNDNDYRPLTINQARRAYYILDAFKVKLVVGNNKISRKSSENELYHDYEHWSDLMEQLESSEKTGSSFKINERQCLYPRNLMLPRGWPVGALYSILTTVTEFNYTYDNNGYHPCNHPYLFDQHSYLFPLDRRINERNFQVKNFKLSEIQVFHSTELHELS